MFGAFVYVFGSIFLKAENAVVLYKASAWWVCLVWFGLLLFALVSCVKTVCRNKKDWKGCGVWAAIVGLAVVAAVGAFTLGREEAAFKIVADEPLLLSTAQEMHRTTQTATIAQAHWIEGQYLVTATNVDKRPPLFSFFVSLLHMASGYSLEHGWQLNAGLLFVFLGLLYLVGFNAKGVWGGVLAVALAGTIAQLSRSANSAGMELLNVTLLAALYLSAAAWLKEQRPEYLSMVILFAVGCALTRYESVLFVVFAGLAIAVGWWRAKRIQLPLAAWLSPLLLLPYVLLDRLYETGRDQFQTFLQGKENLPFSLSYLPENMLAAWRHFTAMDHSQPNSPWLFWVAVALLVVTGIFLRGRERRKDAALIMLAAVMGVWTLLVLSFNYGQFDAAVTQRLALPLWTFLIFCVVCFCGLFRTVWATVALTAATLVVLTAFTAPQTAAHSYSSSYQPTAGMQYIEEFAKANEGKRYLMIADFPQVWALYGVAATSIYAVNGNPEAVANYMATYPEVPVFVFQRIRYDTEKHILVAVDMNWPDDRFKLSIIQEKWVLPTALVRVSKIESVEGVDPMSFRERIETLSVEELFKLLP